MEMSFAQALTEAKQIIIQQSNRIKTDLDKIRSLQETITGQTAQLAEHDRVLREKSAALDTALEQTKAATAKYDEAKSAKEQAEGVIDRQGQRLTQMQESAANFEKQVAELNGRVQQLSAELESAKVQVPTHEDTEALAALASLLSAKKGGGKPASAEAEAAAAA